MNKHLIALAAISLMLTGCGQKKQTSQQPAPAAPKPVAVVIAPVDFDGATLAKVEDRLKANKVDYELVSIQTGKFPGSDGKEIEIKKGSWEAKPDGFRAAVFIGGAGMSVISTDETLKLMAMNFAKAGKKVIAFGEANEVLRQAGFPGNDNAEVATSTGSAVSADAEIGQLVDSLNQ